MKYPLSDSHCVQIYTICREPIFGGGGSDTEKSNNRATTTLIESVTVRQSLTSPLMRFARSRSLQAPLALNGRDEIDVYTSCLNVDKMGIVWVGISSLGMHLKDQRGYMIVVLLRLKSLFQDTVQRGPL